MDSVSYSKKNRASQEVGQSLTIALVGLYDSRVIISLVMAVNR
jgi:hypothetical protein